MLDTKEGRMLNAIEEGWCSIPTRGDALSQQGGRGLLNDKEGVLSMLRRGVLDANEGVLNANHWGTSM